MPYERNWVDPDEILRYKGVVVHEYFVDDEDEFPSDSIVALYSPAGFNDDGFPWFYCLQGEDPICIELLELCRLLNRDTSTFKSDSRRIEWTEALLEQAIDAGILTQDGIVDPADNNGWAEDTQTICMPFDEHLSRLTRGIDRQK